MLPQHLAWRTIMSTASLTRDHHLHHEEWQCPLQENVHFSEFVIGHSMLLLLALNDVTVLYRSKRQYPRTKTVMTVWHHNLNLCLIYFWARTREKNLSLFLSFGCENPSANVQSIYFQSCLVQAITVQSWNACPLCPLLSRLAISVLPILRELLLNTCSVS